MAHCGQEIQCGTRDPNTGHAAKCKCWEEIMSPAKQESEFTEEWWE